MISQSLRRSEVTFGGFDFFSVSLYNEILLYKLIPINLVEHTVAHKGGDGHQMNQSSLNDWL